MLRLGLCCVFRDQPITFANTTATALSRLEHSEARAKLARLCRANADALHAALRFCADNGIGCFRVNSQILPLRTHPRLGYDLTELPGGDAILHRFKECGALVRERDMRTSLHPDQFVVLNSTRPDVVESSLREIESQAEIAGWVGADVITIHGGGAFGDKSKALAALRRGLSRLSSRARSRITLENDDRIYTPADLLPLCQSEGIPLVYDVHHHRCNPDECSEEQATEHALFTWNREPLFHLSSPLEGWEGPKPERHHDYIDVKDFPRCWIGLELTVEVEARAKEAAVLKLKRELENQRSHLSRSRLERAAEKLREK